MVEERVLPVDGVPEPCQRAQRGFRGVGSRTITKYMVLLWRAFKVSPLAAQMRLVDVDLDCFPLFPAYRMQNSSVNFAKGPREKCNFTPKPRHACARAMHIYAENRADTFLWLSTEMLHRPIVKDRNSVLRWSKCKRPPGAFYAAMSFTINRRKWVDIPIPTWTYGGGDVYPRSAEENLHRCRSAYILASFKGQTKTEERQQIVERLRLKGGVLVESNDEEYANPGQRTRYFQMLRNSLFAFVPLGDGWTTFRLMETMAMGVVPVILSSEMALPFEDLLHWPSFSVSVNESEELFVRALPQYLRVLMPKACDMSQVVYTVYHKYMSSPQATMLGVADTVRMASLYMQK